MWYFREIQRSILLTMIICEILLFIYFLENKSTMGGIGDTSFCEVHQNMALKPA